MLETIKKYIQDEHQLKLAKELIDQFEKEQKKIKSPNLKLEKLSISNFGTLQKFSMNFDKNVTFFTGERGTGKSWAMESWLYLLTGSSRDTKGVIGEHGEKCTGELYFNGLLSKWSRNNSGGKVIITKNDTPITESTRQIHSVIEEYTGLNIDLLTSMMFYSPRMSFQFSRKMPFEIEELLINVARLNIWLELEEYAKKLKKIEAEKLSEVIGAIGTVSELNYTKDEMEKLIKQNEKEVAQIDKQIAALKFPNISELNKQYNDLREQLQTKEEIEAQIEQYESLEQQMVTDQKQKDSVNKFIKEINYDSNVKDTLEQQILTLTESLGDIKNKGIQIKTQIDEKQKMVSGDMCPILNINCSSLKDNNATIQQQLKELHAQRDQLLKTYEDIQKQIKTVDNLLQQEKVRESKYVDLQRQIKVIDDKMMISTKEQKAINLTKLQTSLKKYPDSLQKDLEKLDKEIQSVNKEMVNINAQKDDFVSMKTNLLVDIKSYKEKSDRLNKMDQWIKERKRLESRQVNYDELILQFGKKAIPKKEAKTILKNLNKYLDLVISTISNKTISLDINDDFEMSVNCKNIKKTLTAKTVSEGEEAIINLAFILAIGLLTFKGNMPYCFIDDVAPFQSNETAKEIIMGLLALHKKGHIEKLYIGSNRLKDLKLNNEANIIYDFEDGGKYKVQDLK